MRFGSALQGGRWPRPARRWMGYMAKATLSLD
jgi:hypothetical protein